MVSSIAMLNELFHLTSVICLHTVKCFKYGKWLNSSTWPTDGTWTGTASLGQSGPGSNDNERILHIFQNSSIGGTTSVVLMSYLGHSLGQFHISKEM